MLIVVSYDIVDDRRRTQVAKILEDHGQRVQKSVFECHLDERDLIRLKAKLLAQIRPEEDSLRYYRLCGRCRSAIEIDGVGVYTEQDGIVIV